MGGSGCEGPSQEGAGLRLTETHTSVSGTRYAYDTLGRVSGNEQRTAGLAPAAGFHYQYNADDSVASERYPSGQVVTTCYDSLGRVKWVSGASETLDCSSAEGPAGSYVTGVSYTHTAEGEQIGTALGNGLTEVHKRNRRGR
ncbi:MAG: hypothetical protein LC130_08805 [Bryobacterales bacterium]|nr:hypothetical protein [Bryobacterales bacterium]